MFGMKIEEVYQDSEKIKIVTTGAEFVILKTPSQGQIICSQRIGRQRVLATLNFTFSLKDLLLEYQDQEKVIFYKTDPPTEGELRLQVNSDSLLIIRPARPLKVVCEGHFTPEYSAFVENNFICIDQHGGVGGYPLAVRPVSSGFNSTQQGWKAVVHLGHRDELLTSIFPPREYDYAKSLTDRIVHYDYVIRPYPTEEEIKEWRNWGNILVLHSSMWQGRYTRSGKLKDRKTARDAYLDAVWTSFKHIPLDERKLLDTIQAAHDNNMKIIPYVNGIDCSCRREEFISEMRRILETYPFDGLYFDGVSQNIEEAYWMLRNTRKLLGDKILYVHCPSPIIGLYNTYSDNFYVYAPFIDTYADYILRAEHRDVFDLNYLRYTVSGFNISNSIGYLCTYDYPVEELKAIIPDLFKINVRLPYWTGHWVSGEHLVKERDFSDQHEEKLQELSQKEYFPILDRMEKEYFEKGNR